MFISFLPPPHQGLTGPGWEHLAESWLGATILDGGLLGATILGGGLLGATRSCLELADMGGASVMDCRLLPL